MTGEGEYALLCELCLKAAAPWAEAGYAAMHGQTVFPGAAPQRKEAGESRIVKGRMNAGVYGDGFGALFSFVEGGPVAFGRENGPTLFNFAPRPSLYRAPVDNDRGNHFAQASALWHAFSDLATPKLIGCETTGEGLTVRYRFTLSSLTDAAMSVTYTAVSATRIRVDATLSGGEVDLPAFGLSFRLPREMRHVRYYGMGPLECETDRQSGATLGVYQTDADQNLTPYLRPQACGNRTGVRWLEAGDGQGRTLRVQMADHPLQITVLPHSQAELMTALHRQELPVPAYTYLDVACARYGVGGDDSWGAPVLPPFRLHASPSPVLSFTIEAL